MATRKHNIRTAITAGVAGAAALVGMASPALAATGDEHITLIMNTFSSGRAVATGVVSGRGTASGNEDTGVLTVALPQGTLSLLVTPGASEEHANRQACVVTFWGSDTVEVVGGTGAFAGASGSGVDTSRGVVVGSRNPDGSCNPDGDPTSLVDVVHIDVALALGGA